MKFEKLSSEEVERNSRKYRNEYKRQAYKDVINSDTLKFDEKLDKNRTEAFERIWNSALTLTRKRYSFSRRKDLNLPFSAVIKNFVKEHTFYKSSVLGNFMSSEGKNIDEIFAGAEKKTYEDRTKDFMEKYGDENAEDNRGVVKTLKEWFKDYKEDNISREKLNWIIQNFKDENEEYLSNDYHGKNFESADSIKNDYFSND